jgi:hypothetical protein
MLDSMTHLWATIRGISLPVTNSLMWQLVFYHHHHNYQMKLLSKAQLITIDHSVIAYANTQRLLMISRHQPRQVSKKEEVEQEE